MICCIAERFEGITWKVRYEIHEEHIKQPMGTDEQDIIQTQGQKKHISLCHLLISLTTVIADTEVLK